MPENQPTYAVIGGGVSGLTAAYYLRQKRPDAAITVFESSSRLGGVLKTIRNGEFLVEASADMFVTQPSDAMDLCHDLSIEDQLLQTQPVDDRAFIGMGTEIHAVPKGLSMMVPTLEQPILNCDLLSEEGKARFLAEHEVPPQSIDNDESLKSFAVRRFGVEAYEKIIQPMVSGIYTADPDKLSMQATMQRFVTMERQHGSLITALQHDQSSGDRQASGARYGLFRAPKNGMQSLITALVAATPDVEFKTDTRIAEINNAGNQWQVNQTTFAGVILATPAATAATMVLDVDPDLANTLSEITTASSAIVVMGIDRKSIKHEFQGFGIIYPHIDDGQVIAISFSSNKFADRCSDDQLLVRCFIGGAMQSELVDLDDQSLVDIAKKQLNRSLGFDNETIFTSVHRWKNCMPQYHLGHLDRVTKIENRIASHRGLAIAGNSYWGVGIPACIASAKAAVERITTN